MTDTAARSEDTEQLHRVVIRFAGDSGDGMQLTGDRFTSASALFGNDLSTFPDFPAEIRAPTSDKAEATSVFRRGGNPPRVHRANDKQQRRIVRGVVG